MHAPPPCVLALLTALIISAIARPARAGACVLESGRCFPNIQQAIDDATGRTIEVTPGEYPDDLAVTIPDLQLLGARHGVRFDAGRDPTDSASESILHGQVTIRAPGVRLDGFTLTRPALPATATDDLVSVHIERDAHRTVLADNIILWLFNDGAGASRAIVLDGGPDHVVIEDNLLFFILGAGGAQGIFIGPDHTVDPTIGTLIRRNHILFTHSPHDDADAVRVAAPALELGLRDNVITDVDGARGAHGIALVADTTGATISGNVITLRTGRPIAPAQHEAAVYLADNPAYFTVHLQRNGFAAVRLFDDPPVQGIDLHPALAGPRRLDATCNWWDHPAGPHALRTRVAAGVDVGSWLTTDDLTGPCLAPARTPADCRGDAWKRHTRPDGAQFTDRGQCLRTTRQPR